VSERATSTEFLKRFFAVSEYAVELRALPSKARCFTRKPREVQKFIQKHAHENVYFGVATREDGGGDKSHCRELTALWADVDFKTTPEPHARELLTSLSLQPSIVIESGGGLHAYWLLETPIHAHDERIEPVLRGLATNLGADGAAAEIARLMRLPGTYNHKYRAPRECRITEADWNRRYALREFEKFAEHKLEAPKKPNDAGDRIIDGRRNVALTSIAGQMRHHIGMTESEILGALLSINARRYDPPLEKTAVEKIANSVGRYQSAATAGGSPIDPWPLAVGMETFLEGEDEALEFMEPRVIAKGSITEVFSPRGLGKSIWAAGVAVKQAKARKKVLLIDRDNPRRLVKERLRALGATSDLATLKFLSRENAPPLTKSEAWAAFPYAEYDLLIVDSLDSAAEGVGEQDSAKPSRAIAPLLDIAHSLEGPAVLLLGNCVKAATHSRGSGIIEDRADVVFEVRDATDLRPSGKKPWIEELPPADAKSWVSRSLRRNLREKYRLAFIPTKYRIGEEPDPFILEIDLTAEPWSVRDVTDDVDREGKAERERQAKERAVAVEAAVELLRAEILRREDRDEPFLLKKQAEEFLAPHKIKQKIARDAINSAAFQIVEVAGKGHPKEVHLAGKNSNVNRNTTPSEPASDAGSSDSNFGQPQPERATEVDPQEAQRLSRAQTEGSSVDSSSATPPVDLETPGKAETDYVDQEIEL
jgi:hypothetical protein